MYYTDDSLLPENMQPTHHHGGAVRSGVAAGRRRGHRRSVSTSRCRRRSTATTPARTMLHFHVRDPKTGRVPRNFDQYNELLGARAAGGAEDDHPGRRLDLVRAAHRRRQGEVARLRHPPHADRARSEARVRHRDHRHHAVGHRRWRCSPRTTSRARTWTIRRCGGLERHGGGLDAGLLRRAPEAAAQERHPALLRARARAPARDHRAADPHRRVHGAAERGAVRLRRRLDGPQSVRLDGDAAPHAARRVERDLLEQHARQHRHPDPGDRSSASNVRVGNEDNLWDMHKKRWSTVEAGRVGGASRASSSAARWPPPTRRARS